MELKTQTFAGSEGFYEKEPRLIYQLEAGGNDQDTQPPSPDAKKEAPEAGKTPEEKEAQKNKERLKSMPEGEFNPDEAANEVANAEKSAEQETAKEVDAMAKVQSDMEQTVEKTIQNDESKKAIQY